MLTKAAFGLAIVLATFSSSLAASSHGGATWRDKRSFRVHRHGPSPTVYNPNGAYIGTDPDPRIRFELKLDGDRTHSN